MFVLDCDNILTVDYEENCDNMLTVNDKELFINKINDALISAFGNKVRGNLRYADCIADDWFTPENYLGMISKKRWFGEDPIGKFLESDGSSLIIKPRFEEQAEDYCRLYEELFDNKVTVELGNPFEYFVIRGVIHTEHRMLMR